MTPNGTCVKCGTPAFIIGTSVECSTQSCDNFNIKFAAAQKDLSKIKRLKQSEITENPCKDALLRLLGHYWIFNTVPGNPRSIDHKEGPPKGNFIYSKEDLEKYSAIGIYAPDHSGTKVSSSVDPGNNILEKIEKDRKKS